MATVAKLIPGETVRLGSDSAVFVTSAQHPQWPSLRLVIWAMPDGTWSLDALRADQEVGDCDPSSATSRGATLDRVFRLADYRAWISGKPT